MRAEVCLPFKQLVLDLEDTGSDREDTPVGVADVALVEHVEDSPENLVESTGTVLVTTGVLPRLVPVPGGEAHIVCTKKSVLREMASMPCSVVAFPTAFGNGVLIYDSGIAGGRPNVMLKVLNSVSIDTVPRR